MHRIGILSDTHGSVPNDLHDKLAGVDCILHAGDLGSEDVLLDLQAIAPVYAVHGNIDFFELSHQLPRERIVEVASVRFGLIHGDRFHRGNIVNELIRYFQKAQVDMIVFGHTHEYYIRQHGNIWLVNPGSSNCNHSPSGVLLTIDKGEKFRFQKLAFCEMNRADFDFSDDSFD